MYKVIKLQPADEPPFRLLMLADETRAAIEKYIYGSDVYMVYMSGISDPVGVFVLRRLDTGTVEIKNIAVAENMQRKGIGSFMMRWIDMLATAVGYEGIMVGTPDGALAEISFYKKNGYSECGFRRNFYVENYDRPIVENGVMLRDMQMLYKKTAVHEWNDRIRQSHK